MTANSVTSWSLVPFPVNPRGARRRKWWNVSHLASVKREITEGRWNLEGEKTSLCSVKKFCATFYQSHAMPERMDFIWLFSGCDRLRFESKLSLCECLGCSNAFSVLVMKTVINPKDSCLFFSQKWHSAHLATEIPKLATCFQSWNVNRVCLVSKQLL